MKINISITTGPILIYFLEHILLASYLLSVLRTSCGMAFIWVISKFFEVGEAIFLIIHGGKNTQPQFYKLRIIGLF